MCTRLQTLRSVALVDSDAVWIALATVDSKPAQLCLQPPSGVFQPIEQVAAPSVGVDCFSLTQFHQCMPRKMLANEMT
jgi:hypothetical protein